MLIAHEVAGKDDQVGPVGCHLTRGPTAILMAKAHAQVQIAHLANAQPVESRGKVGKRKADLLKPRAPWFV